MVADIGPVGLLVKAPVFILRSIIIFIVSVCDRVIITPRPSSP